MWDAESNILLLLVHLNSESNMWNSLSNGQNGDKPYRRQVKTATPKRRQKVPKRRKSKMATNQMAPRIVSRLRATVLCTHC